jgi:hypothetical protein
LPFRLGQRDPVSFGHATPPCVAEPPQNSFARGSRHGKADGVLVGGYESFILAARVRFPLRA